MLPVDIAAISLAIATPRLPNKAAYTAFLDRPFKLPSSNRGYCYLISITVVKSLFTGYVANCGISFVYIDILNENIGRP